MSDPTQFPIRSMPAFIPAVQKPSTSTPGLKEEPPHLSGSAAAAVPPHPLQSKYALDWDDFDDRDDGDADLEEKTIAEKKRLFSKELRLTLYGQGDDQNPYTETVDFLEDLVMEFITSMTQKAMEIGRTGRVQVEDIIFLVRKEERMYARVRELLTMNEELKKARKAFDEIKYV